jgi:hypothetical protein
VISPATALLGIMFSFFLALPFAWSLAKSVISFTRERKISSSPRSLLVNAAIVAVLVAAIYGLLPSVSPMDFNPYEELGIPMGSATSAVNKAYRRLSLSEHPDKGGNAARFRRIARAYEALVDPEARMKFERYGNPEGENHAEAYGDFSKASSSEKKAVLALYLGGVAAFMIAAGIYGWRTGNLGESPEERAEREALLATDSIPAAPGVSSGVPSYLWPPGYKMPSPAVSPALPAGANFYASFGPLFKRASESLKSLDDTGAPWPTLGDASTPVEAVKAFYETWRKKAVTKLKNIDYFAVFQNAYKKLSSEKALAAMKEDSEAWENFQRMNFLDARFGVTLRYKADQDRLGLLVKAAEKADPRLRY